MDLSHLNALELGLSNERARLRSSKNGKEFAARVVWIDQREREIAAERKFLGLPEVAPQNLSDEELLRELSA